MLRTLPPLLAALLIVGTGIVHGYWTDRWVPAAEPREAADRYAMLPMTVGDWDGKDPEKPMQSVPGVVGSFQRHYTHRVTGVTLTVTLVCGRPGPVSIHTPDSCYTASGFDFGTRSPLAVAQNADFWTADAVKAKASDETRLRLFWAWNAGQGWKAPDDARTTYARYPVLHKLYVQRELNSLAEPVKDDPGLSFLRAFLPELNAKLFAPAL
jgi:hypothetical protein